jgi:hypothetical protein
MQTHFDCMWAEDVHEHILVGEQVFMPSTPGAPAHDENTASQGFLASRMR